MKVKTIDFRSNDRAEQFKTSLHETGFAVIKNHYISSIVIDKAYKEWIKFFKSSNKHEYLYDRDSNPQDGYFPYLSESAKDSNVGDLKEFYHFYLEGRHPHYIKNIPTILMFAHLSQMAAHLLSDLDKVNPESIKKILSMPLENMIERSDNTLLRIINYPPLTDNELPGALRAAPHEDINLITLLVTSTSGGLQVKDRDGFWHDVEIDPGTIVVNSGDMLQEATAGYYPSTSHRVINPDRHYINNVQRLSMPLFVHARSDVRISDRYIMIDYLNKRLRDLGLMD